MRKLFLAIMVLVLLAIPYQMAISQVVDNGSTALVIGARYEAQTLGTYGLAINIGGPLWEVTTLDIVEDPTVNIEVMALFKLPVGQRFYGGFVAGANTTWLEQPDNTSFLNYLQAAAGVVGSYAFSYRVGIGGYLKRIIPLEENALSYEWVGGVAFFLRL